MPTKLLELFDKEVQPEWIDYNQHMSEGYYVLVFGFATEALQDLLNVGLAYRSRTGSSVYTAESHITFLQEVKEGDPLHISTQLLGFDSKRIHIFHAMTHDDTGALVATTETMLLHVDSRPKVTDMPEPVFAQLTEIYRHHQRLPIPSQVGHQIGF